ncbi:MAG: ATPase, T2SS/T4P/T4SS family [Chloroflexota bacterium]
MARHDGTGEQNGMDRSDGSEEPVESIRDRLRSARARSDAAREPDLLPSRQGRRQYSVKALVERIIAQFIDEHGQSESAPVRAAHTEADRLKLIRDAADYVIAVESIQVTSAERAEIIRQVYAEMFSYGPLDDLLADPALTTISLEGADKLAVRRGHADLTPLAPVFEDEEHVRRVIRRLVEDAGARLDETTPLIEAGLKVAGRRVSVNVVGPPAAVLTTADIRLHPVQPPTLDDLVRGEVMPPLAADLLDALARSAHGLVVVGESESGKTTLLGVLARLMPLEQRARLVAVERAGELALPEEASRRVVQWQTDQHPGLSFADRVNEALALGPTCLLLDEVRADEAAAVGPLLAEGAVPPQMWAFRGPADAKRLASSLGMLARRSDPASGEAAVHRLYERLPFVVTLRRRQGKLLLHQVSEWQYPPGADYPDQVELLAQGWHGLERTGNRPQHPLDLPDVFWV